MKSIFTHPSTSIVALVLFALATLLVPSSATAGWDDNSDELPGMDGTDLTPYLVVGGVLVGGVILYKILSHKSDDDKKADKPESSAEPTDGEADSTSGEEVLPSEGASSTSLDVDQNPRLGLYFDITSDDYESRSGEQAKDFSDLTVKVGFSVGF